MAVKTLKEMESLKVQPWAPELGGVIRELSHLP